MSKIFEEIRRIEKDQLNQMGIRLLAGAISNLNSRLEKIEDMLTTSHGLLKLWEGEQLSEPEGKEEDFLTYVKAVRVKFSNQMLEDSWWIGIGPKRRVMIEDVLIAYDQMVAKLEPPPTPPESIQ